MKIVAPLLLLFSIFAVLTNPAGDRLFVAKAQVVVVRAPHRGECTNDGNSVVVTSTGTFCVAEDPEDAAAKIGEP